MSQTMQDIEAAALQMPPEERGRLASLLLQSLEPAPNDSPENIAQAWDEEIARRIEAMDGGVTESIAYEQVRADLRAMIGVARER
jgi:putative addiction module component (TIGR02574 family)